ncbi:hypothetical protein AAG906_029737 [Vitis piasezkii]
MANAHRRRNQLTIVKVNRRWFIEESEIKEEAGRTECGRVGEYSWDFVKVEMMNFFRQFHESGSFGWQIMNAVLIVDETINSILKSNKGAILCKLDIEKAYDHVDWSFLLAVLEKLGFGEKWQLKGFKARRSPFALLVRNCDVGLQLFAEESSF